MRNPTRSLGPCQVPRLWCLSTPTPNMAGRRPGKLMSSAAVASHIIPSPFAVKKTT